MSDDIFSLFDQPTARLIEDREEPGETYWFRYFVEVGESYTRIWLRKYRVLRFTLKGVWVSDPWGPRTERFCLLGRGKRWAHEKREFAQESYRARTKRRIRILKSQLTTTEMGLEAFNEEFPV